MRGDGVFGSQKAVMQLGKRLDDLSRPPVRESSCNVAWLSRGMTHRDRELGLCHLGLSNQDQ